MKILFVAFPFSIHTVRWLNQLVDGDFEIHLYSSHRNALPHAQLSNKIIYHSNPLNLGAKKSILKRVIKKIDKTIFRNETILQSPEQELLKLASKLKPTVIHSLESQHAGYLVSEVKDKMGSMDFPIWIHSNWGIDLHFFGRIEEHIGKIKNMLSGINFFIAEGERDVLLAKSYGYINETLIFPSVGGGFKIPIIDFVKPSQRKKIILKGTQDIVRRGLCALRALEICKDLLNDYEIILYSSCYETKIAAELFFHSTGNKIIIAEELSQEQVLILASEARISICTNLSDGLPNAMLEAMMMGSFPIQSNTCISDGWIENDTTGFLVPPEDSELIAAKIRIALTNNKLVDEAATINMNLIKMKLGYEFIKNEAIKMYKSVYKN